MRGRPGKTARLLALIPLCLLGIMALLALFFAAGPLLGDGESVRALGVWAGCAFLLLGVPVPLGSVICGACSLWFLKGQRAWGWKAVAVLDIVLGALAAAPCLGLVLAGVSGQM